MSTTPVLSVIMPVYNGRSLLPDTLGALHRSDLDRSSWEVVVVDDASTDDSAEVAGPMADRVLRLSGRPRGPAFARNRGAEVCRGSVLVFVDADVRLATDALGRLARLFESGPDLGAAFGSYDDQPSAPGVVSRYRNLLHHYHHQRGAGDAETFWAGLGAVRADVFRRVGGFDEVRYARPQIEDIELGRSIRRAGHRIALDPRVQGTHLKRWTLVQVLRTDLFHRGIPWTRLLLREGAGGGSLNVSPREKLCVALVGIGAAALLGAGLARSLALLALGGAAIATVVAMNLPMYRYMSRGRGLGFAVAVVPLHLMYYGTSGVAYALGHLAHRIAPKHELDRATALRSEADDA
jgi:glycosyltransferase involved in cell wall biosynthesis